MFKYLLLNLLLLTPSVFSFSPCRPASVQRHAVALHMFSADNNEKAKESVKSAVTETKEAASEALTEMSAEVSNEVGKAKNLVKNMNTGEMQEVKWVDPAMRANTNPFELDWYGWFLLIFPATILLNDAFHFLPTEGPLGFFGRI